LKNNLIATYTIYTTYTYNNLHSDDINDIPNIFSSYFASVYSKHTQSTLINFGDNSNSNNCNVNVSNVDFSLSEIFQALTQVGNNPSPGPDLIPALFLQRCRYALSVPIFIIFQLSISSGIFPDKWKLSYVTPIFKSGDKGSVTNYRPISIISVIPKLFEKIINNKLTTTFKSTLLSNQYGFRSQRSTSTNLLVFYSDLISTVESGGQVDVIYTDLKKAFDTVDIKILLYKLKLMGVHGTLLNWFESYLSNRRQRVKVNNILSDSIEVTSGVPQGGHLSPLLYYFYYLLMI